MLDCRTETVPPVAQIERLPCSVVLSAAWEAKLEIKGPVPTFPGCRRRFPRFRCGGKTNRVALEHQQSLPGLPRERAWFAAYVIDIGRSGIALLHGEILYPKERLRIVLMDGSLRQIEVVRCQRLDAHCYRVGARFVGGEPGPGISK
jgi:hypothetical protein